jgi:general secretion pathway protein A
MYEAFYQFKEKPFSLLPDPDFLFLSSKHAVAMSMLEYSLAGQAGFCAITGEIGSGKTTLIRALLRRIGRDVTLGLISNTHSSHTELAAWALAAFGQQVPTSSNADVYQALMHFLINEYSAGRRCVLIVDEAQNLTIESLEELRLLSNINSERDLLLQIILVGQPQLLEKLKRPEMCQFAQRISVAYHLTPLDFEETRRYINHRLTIAGTTREIFSDLAMGAIQYYSGGVPRLVNSICDMALVYGYAESLKSIELETVLKVIRDRQASGVAGFVKNEQSTDPSVKAAIHAMVSDSHAKAPSRKGAASQALAAKGNRVQREPVLSSAGSRLHSGASSSASADGNDPTPAPAASPTTGARTSTRLEPLTDEDQQLRLDQAGNTRPTPHRMAPNRQERTSWLRRAFGRPA